MYLTHGFGQLTEVATGRHWGHLEVRRQILSRVGAYQRLGLRRGDRVLMQLGNCLEFFADLVAVWTLGCCAIPVDRRLTPFEIERLVNVTGARFTLVDYRAESKDIATAGVTRIHSQEAADSTYTVAGSALHLDDDGLILFTSGSTGQPKGVVHTHRSLLARWTTLRASLGLDAYTRTLCILPTSFGHGLICNCLFPWLAGCDLFIAPPFRPDIVASLGKLIDEHRITFMSSVPSVWNLALRASPSPVKKTLHRIHVGSAPLSAALWSQIREWAGVLEVFNAYGITETASWTAGTTSGAVAPEDGLIGTPWGASIKVCRARSSDAFIEAEECSPDEEGMVWLNTPALMKGYFQRNDLTNAVVSQGWFMTGDIGVLDARGYLFLRGRERDEINKGGMKVFPEDVDAVAGRVVGVADVCTFAIEDLAYGENVAIAVVLQETGMETIRRLYESLRTHLAEHKQPVRWYLLDEIPRNSRGKIDRRSVKKVCDKREPADLRALLQDKNRKEIN